ncbi:MAG: hypothetical protein AAF772_04115 [Acidobacteriota bacterium]
MNTHHLAAASQSHWSADFANDHLDDYNLCMYIYCDDEFWGAIHRLPDNSITLTIYPQDTSTTVPVAWLNELLAQAEKELPLREDEPDAAASLLSH